MRNQFGRTAATLATLALITSPVMAQQVQPDRTSDQAALNRFLVDVNAIQSNLPSSGYDVSEAGGKCTAAIDALVEELPATIISSIRCDVGDTGGIVILGGAALR